MDRSRPALMTVTVGAVRQSDGPAVSAVPASVRLKFRGEASKFLDVNNSGLRQRDDAVHAFHVNFHSVSFDKLKVDLYEGEVGWLRRRPKHRGRGRIAIKDMGDWHNGSYSRSVTLYDPKSINTEIGTIELSLKFSTLLLPEELMEEDLEVVFANNVMSYEDGDEDDEEIDGEESDQQDVLNVLIGDLTAEPEESQDIIQEPESPKMTTVTPESLKESSAPVPVSLKSPRTRQFLRAETRKRLSTRDLDRSQSQITSPTSDQEVSPNSPNNRKISHTSTIRSRSTGRSMSSAGSASVLSPPKVLSDNTKNNISEITAMTLGMLKHEFPLSASETVRAVRLLYDFENGLSVPRTGKIIKSLSKAEEAVRFMKHSLCVYGALVLGFCNGTMNFRDNLRTRSNEKTTAEYLGLKLEDVLYWDKRPREISTTRHYVIYDSQLDGIVLCCQGTIHLAQIITDLNAEYFPLQNGAAHRGILRAAQSILDLHLTSLLNWCAEKKAKYLYCTGHSLGAGTAALLTILLHEHLDQFRDATNNPDFKILGRCIATPAVATHGLADANKSLIDNFVMENDIVPRMSFGSLIDFKEMLLEANRLIQLKLSTEETFALLQKKRIEILKGNRDTRGVIPGRVYHIYKTVRRVPRRHHARLGLNASIFETAYRTVDLPPEEKPEIPHYVMELARPEFFAFIAPRRHILNHHLPWAYSKGVWGVKEWLEDEGRALDQ